MINDLHSLGGYPTFHPELQYIEVGFVAQRYYDRAKPFAPTILFFTALSHEMDLE